MSQIDLPLVNPIITPAKEAVQWPLTWMRLVQVQTPDTKTIQAYAELQPMRRLTDGSVELKPEVDKDIVPIHASFERPVLDESAGALVEQTVGAFLAQGGNVLALTETLLLLIVKDQAVRQGKLAQAVVDPPPVVPDPVPDVPPVNP